jgi:hypothetical protein
MQHITIEDLDRWGACCREDEEDYCDARLKRLARGRKGLTGLEVSRMRSIPYEDRIWVLLRREVLGDALKGVVETIVARAVRRHALPCSTTREWARRWLSGEDRSEEAAWAAARAAAAKEEAAWAAARAAAARAAAWAAWATAKQAALAAAARAAARAEARAEARAAAWAAERQWQLGVIRRALRRMEHGEIEHRFTPSVPVERFCDALEEE